MPADSGYITPSTYAKRLGVSVHKVHFWIKSGELVAINVARDAGRRPRWSIPADALIDFERRRLAQPKPEVPRRRRKRDAEVIEFF